MENLLFVCITYIHMKCRIIKSGVVCVYMKMGTHLGHYATVMESCPTLLSDIDSYYSPQLLSSLSMDTFFIF